MMSDLGPLDVATRESLVTTRTRKRLSDKVLPMQKKKHGKGILEVASYTKSANVDFDHKVPAKLVVPEEVKPNFSTPCEHIIIGTIPICVDVVPS